MSTLTTEAPPAEKPTKRRKAKPASERKPRVTKPREYGILAEVVAGGIQFIHGLGSGEEAEAYIKSLPAERRSVEVYYIVRITAGPLKVEDKTIVRSRLVPA